MRRAGFARRWVVGVGCVGVAAVLPFAIPASAATSKVVVSNWYYDDPGQSASAAASHSTPSLVPANDLGVGYQVGTGPAPGGAPVTTPDTEADKITALSFDISSLAAGSTVTSFTFSMPVDTSDANSEAQVGGVPPAIAACLSERTFEAAAGPSEYQQRPSFSCTGSDRVAGLYDPTTSAYDFKATAIAQKWFSDSNTGLVVLPDPSANSTTFTLSFKGPASITAAITGTAPAASSAPAAVTPVGSSPSATRAPAVTSSTRSAPVSQPAHVAGPAATSAAAPAAAAPAAAPVAAAPVAAAAVPAAAAPVSEAPVVADSPAAAAPDDAAATAVAAAAPAAVTPARQAAASRPLKVSSGIGAFDYVVVVLIIVGILAATSLGLAKPPEAAGARTSRLATLLDSQS